MQATIESSDEPEHFSRLALAIAINILKSWVFRSNNCQLCIGVQKDISDCLEMDQIIDLANKSVLEN